MDKIDGINITDQNITYIKLPSGVYLVDGEVIEVTTFNRELVKCRDLDNVRIITNNKIILEYRCGEEAMTPAEYEARKFDLFKKYYLSDTLDNSGNECHFGYWATLEDEFAYRKFTESWKPIYKTIQVSDPIKVEVEKIVYSTGNPYIKSAFLNGDSPDETLYSYQQGQSWKDFVKECFDELGMAYEENASYSQTANRKIWSNNSSYSCIRYVCAFGTYVFGDSWGNPKVLKGTLNDMEERCKKDRETIRNIIISQYNKHFGNIDAGKFDFNELLKKLNLASSLLKDIKVYQKSTENYYHCMRNINDCIAQINAAYNSDTIKP